MFAIRGWLLTVVGGLLALYYTDNIDMSEAVLRWGLPLVALLFLGAKGPSSTALG